MKIYIRISFVFLISVYLSSYIFAQGTIYNIDFKANYPLYEGKGILGTVPDSKWNGLTNTNVPNVTLINSRGVAENATVSTSGFGGSFGLRFSYAWGDFSDYWYMNSSNSPIISFKNLTAGQPYDLVLYCYAGDNNQSMRASVNGGLQESTSGVRNVIQWAENPDPNSNYLRFTGLVPENGILNINLSTASSGANIQGLQLQVGTISIPVGTRTNKLIPDLAAGYKVKVMTIGTSLTDMPFGVSWPSELYSALFPKYQGYMVLSNRAISGSNSKSGVANIEQWLAIDNPDVVFIEYGINDAIASDNISVQQMKANLDFICAKILANNPKAEIILQTMNNPVGSALSDRPNIEQYYQGYRDYAAAKGYLLVDNYPLWKNLYDTNPTLWATYVGDRIHPSGEGRAAIMLPNLIKTLEGELNLDKTAPSAPTNLTTSAITSLSLVLNWNASTDNVGVTAYNIYQGNNLIGSTLSNTYSVTKLTANTAYTFIVKAKDLAGNISAASAPTAVTTGAPDLAVPSTPVGVIATSITGKTAQLNWTMSTDNVGVVGYEVYKDGILIGSPPSNSFYVTGLLPVTSYNFTVKAIDASSNLSFASDVLKVTTIAVDEITARGENKPGEGLDKLTDGDLNSKWLDFSATSWVQFANAMGQKWNSYEITSANDAPERDPKDWTISGSNDGKIWTILDTRLNETWVSRNLTRTFTFTNSNNYSFYKWNITANGSGAMIQVSEFNFIYNNLLSTYINSPNLSYSIFPNPVVDNLNLRFEKKIEKGEVIILDSQGRMLLTKSIENTNYLIMEVQNLEAGVYNLLFKSADQVINKMIFLYK